MIDATAGLLLLPVVIAYLRLWVLAWRWLRGGDRQVPS